MVDVAAKKKERGGPEVGKGHAIYVSVYRDIACEVKDISISNAMQQTVTQSHAVKIVSNS